MNNGPVQGMPVKTAVLLVLYEMFPFPLPRPFPLLT